MFIAIDGDDVGRIIELYIIDEQINDLECFTISITNRFEWLVSNLCSDIGAKIHLLGGDSILASCDLNENTLKFLEKLRVEFQIKGLPTISIGIGNTAREAYLALKYAKLRGKNRLIRFEEIKQ